jgi:uncharacterized protein with von Willebrand factor type A (vWA) domain
MLVDFFYHLRTQKLKVSVKEYLTLLEALSTPLMPPTLEDFYFLARTTPLRATTAASSRFCHRAKKSLWTGW